MSLLILMIGISACNSTPTLKPVPCPPRPLLDPLTQEQNDALPDEVFEKVAGNQIKLKGYAKKLEVRAGCGEQETD